MKIGNFSKKSKYAKSFYSRSSYCLQQPAHTCKYWCCNSPIKRNDSFLQFSEMYQWLKDAVNSVNLIDYKDLLLTQNLKQIFEQFESTDAINLMQKIQNELLDKLIDLKNKNNNDQMTSKSKMDLKFFLISQEKLLADEYFYCGTKFLENLLSTDNFQCSVVALTSELDSFVRDNTMIDATSIMKICSINAFDFWRIINSFGKSIKGIPPVLKRHLFEQEISIMFDQAWVKSSPIIELLQSHADDIGWNNTNISNSNHNFASQNIFNNSISNINQLNEINDQVSMDVENNSQKENSKEKLTLSHELFFKKLLRFLGERIYQLCYYISFKQEQMEFVWEIVKFIISEKIDITL